MELSKIIAISGKPGLFKVLAKSKNGVVVESVVDGQRFTAHSSYIISSFEDISIYSNNDDYPLKNVFKKISEKLSGDKCLDHKSTDEELKKFMIELLPDYDQDRVYVSDIRKLVKWYNILIEAKILDELLKEDEEESGAEAGSEDGKTAGVKVKEITKKAPAKKDSVKKTVAKKEPAMKAPIKRGAS
ncbi:MAG: DUF5606 domain-containing protein, partial [Bacteroidetes bacterium]|nr:DUF5606 domain-containing protein [Bacteroidota bacterium]